MAHRFTRFLAVTSAVLLVALAVAPGRVVATSPSNISLYSADAPFARSRVVKVGFVEVDNTAIDEYVLSESSTVDGNGKLTAGVDVTQISDWTFGSDGPKTLYGQIHYAGQPTDTWTSAGSLTITIDSSISSVMSLDLSAGFIGTGRFQVYDAEGSAHFRGYTRPTDGSPASGFSVEDGTWSVTFYSSTGFANGAHPIGTDASMSIVRTPGSPSCDITSGSYTIEAVTLDAGPPDLDVADVDFTGQCNSGARATGSVRYGSTRSVAALSETVDLLSFTGSLGSATAPDAQSVTFTNIGAQALTIGAPTITGSGHSSFGESSDCGPLEPGDECTVQVQFIPTAPGTVSATLTLPDSATNRSWDVRLMGYAAYPTNTDITLSPDLPTYGGVTRDVVVTVTPALPSGGAPVVKVDGGQKFGPETTGSDGTKSIFTYRNISLSVGSHTISADYAGQPNYEASSDELTFDLAALDGDVTAPIGQIAVTHLHSGYTNDPNVQTRFPATDDDTGVARFEFRVVLPDQTGPWTNVDVVTGNEVVSWWIQPGVPHLIEARWFDRAGNVSETQSVLVTVDTAPPTVQAPSEYFVEDSTVIGGKVGVEIPVNASDTLSGVDSLTLNQKTGTGAWKNVPIPPGASVTEGQADLLLATGKSYTFRARATDVATNQSGWATSPSVNIKQVQESSSLIRYSSGWKTTKSTSDWGGFARTTTKAGATATIKVNGRAIALVSKTASDRGKIQVSIDGKLVRPVDLSISSANQRLVWTYEFGTKSTHTIKITVLSSGKPVDLDAFILGQ